MSMTRLEKALVFSDIHLDWVTRGLARFDDLAQSLHEMADRAIKEKVDVAFFLGDLCDPDRNLSPMRCVTELMYIAYRFEDAGIDFRAISGNHDVIEDGSGTTTLTPFRVFEKFNGFPTDRRGPRVYESPAIVSYIGGWHFLALPFTPLSHTYDPCEWVAKTMDESYPLVVLSHLNVEGIVPGSETKEMPRGRDVWLPLGMLKQRKAPTVILNGHYHNRRVTPEGLAGQDVIIPGSLGALTFGEEKHEPGYLFLEFS